MNTSNGDHHPTCARQLPRWRLRNPTACQAERTRTPKRHFRKAVERLGKFSLARQTLWDPRRFARDLEQKIVEMTSAGSYPLSPARQLNFTGEATRPRRRGDRVAIRGMFSYGSWRKTRRVHISSG